MKWISIMIFLVALSAAAQNSYYISPSGNDGNDGSQARPWRTLGHADGNVTVGASGTVVHVAAGTYNASLTCSNSGYNSVLCINQGGSSPTARLVYQCDTPATLAMVGTTQGCYVQLTPNSNLGTIQIPISLFGSSSSANNVDIVGFHIAPNVDAYSGIATVCNPGALAAGSQCPTANSVHIIGNLVESGASARAAICSNSGSDVGAGIIAGSRHSYWVSDSQVIGNMVMPWGSPTCYRGYGVYLNSKGQIAYNNLVFGGAIGIHIYSEGCGERIANNVLVNQRDYGMIVWGTNSFSGESAICATKGLNTINNNIIVNVGVGYTAQFGDSGSGIQLNSQCDGSHPTLISNNLMFGNTHANITGYNGGAIDSCAIVRNTLTESPTNTFVNFQNNGTGDYHLKNTSVAANAGTTNCVTGGISPCTPSIDIEANVRSATVIDIGPYATGVGVGASAPPSAPTGLTATVN